MSRTDLIREFHKIKYEGLGYLKFNPINRFNSCGNEIQVCTTKFKGIGITERTFFPYNFMLDITSWYILDLILPIDYPIQDGHISDQYYTDEGYGVPEFSTLEYATKFIKQYKNNE